MSFRLFRSDILFFQRILSSCGFYNGPLNGVWSLAVESAEAAFIAETNQIKQQLGSFDARSEGNIETLIPAAQRKARECLNLVNGEPLTYRILSGTRTYAEQDALFAKRPKVTNAKGGQSNHNFGIAWDIGIFENGKYYTGANSKENKAYEALGAKVKAALPGLEWGGDWKSFVDRPHYQLSTGKTTAQVCKLFEKGKPYV